MLLTKPRIILWVTEDHHNSFQPETNNPCLIPSSRVETRPLSNQHLIDHFLSLIGTPKTNPERSVFIHFRYAVCSIIDSG